MCHIAPNQQELKVVENRGIGVWKRVLCKWCRIKSNMSKKDKHKSGCEAYVWKWNMSKEQT